MRQQEDDDEEEKEDVQRVMIFFSPLGVQATHSKASHQPSSLPSATFNRWGELFFVKRSYETTSITFRTRGDIGPKKDPRGPQSPTDPSGL